MLFLSFAEQRQRQEDGHQKLTMRTQTTRIRCSSLWWGFQWFYNYCNLKTHQTCDAFQRPLKDFFSTSRTFHGTLSNLSSSFFTFYIALQELFFLLFRVFSNMFETLLKRWTVLLKGFHMIIKTMKNLSTTLIRDFLLYCSKTQWLFAQSLRNLWHMIEKHTELMKDKICIHQKLCVIKLKYKCIFMWHNII